MTFLQFRDPALDYTKVEPDTPILIGSGQITQRIPEDLATVLGPIDLMMECVRHAATDAGLEEKDLRTADSLRVVHFMTGVYEDPVGLLAQRLGVSAQDMMYTSIGGNSPQMLVNATAEALSEGRIRLAILAGVEALGSTVAAMKQGITPDWVERDGAGPGVEPPSFAGTADYEVPYEFQRPINVYPLFENAIRAHNGWSIDEHMRRLGELFAPMSRVAAQHPGAWFPNEYTPEEISTVTKDNRMIGFPYTKRMNAVIRVDQSAAVIMTTVGAAREIGIDPGRWVFLHGCADAADHWLVSERENYYASPAHRIAGRTALDMAGVPISDIEYVDLYSCFPSAVQIGRDALGIDPDDPRPLTVTGGLPYHGGPANNYVMHAIATTMDRLRAKPGSFGICTAMGWYITKHAIGIYSTTPVEGTWKREDPAVCQAEIDARPKPEIAIEASGPCIVETYTVLHERSGPERGIVVGRLEDDRRFLAVTPEDPALWERMMTEEVIGKQGTVAPGPQTNTITLD